MGFCASSLQFLRLSLALLHVARNPLAVAYNGVAYSAGGWTATIIQAPALAKSALSAGRAGLAYANAVDDAGRCANWVSKVVRGGWYVGDVERHAAQRFSAKSTVGTGDWRKQVRA